jgi:hypothetical protein
VVIFIRLPATMQRVLRVIAFVVGLGTFCETAGAETKVDALRVSISVFSGRPDPVFLITDTKLIKEIITMAMSLPTDNTFSGETVIPSTLGYRGVVIDNVSKVEPDVQEILVNGANVELHRSTATKGLSKEFRLDSGAKLEARLFELAVVAKVVRPGFFQAIKAEKVEGKSRP